MLCSLLTHEKLRNSEELVKSVRGFEIELAMEIESFIFCGKKTT